MHPKVLLLDEPTSALDPPAAEEVLAALQRLVHDLGLTVLVTEHRLERVVQYADRVVRLTGDGGPRPARGPRRASSPDSPVVPPVVELGRLAGWSPLPLSVRDARRRAGPLRDAASPTAGPRLTRASTGRRHRQDPRAGRELRRQSLALRSVDLDLRAGEVVAVMGRNGAGKSTLLQALVGAQRPNAGEVRIGGVLPALSRRT